jgi:hypothetical protein
MGAVNLSARLLKTLPDEQAAQHVVHEDRSIVPIESKESTLARFQGGCFPGEFLVQCAVAFADHLDPPLENVINGRLAGLDTIESGEESPL